MLMHFCCFLNCHFSFIFCSKRWSWDTMRCCPMLTWCGFEIPFFTLRSRSQFFAFSVCCVCSILHWSLLIFDLVFFHFFFVSDSSWMQLVLLLRHGTNIRSSLHWTQHGNVFRSLISPNNCIGGASDQCSKSLAFCFVFLACLSEQVCFAGWPRSGHLQFGVETLCKLCCGPSARGVQQVWRHYLSASVVARVSLWWFSPFLWRPCWARLSKEKADWLLVSATVWHPL